MYYFVKFACNIFVVLFRQILGLGMRNSAQELYDKIGNCHHDFTVFGNVCGAL